MHFPSSLPWARKYAVYIALLCLLGTRTGPTLGPRGLTGLSPRNVLGFYETLSCLPQSDPDRAQEWAHLMGPDTVGVEVRVPRAWVQRILLKVLVDVLWGGLR